MVVHVGRCGLHGPKEVRKEKRKQQIVNEKEQYSEEESSFPRTETRRRQIKKTPPPFFSSLLHKFLRRWSRATKILSAHSPCLSSNGCLRGRREKHGGLCHGLDWIHLLCPNYRLRSFTNQFIDPFKERSTKRHLSKPIYLP